MNKVLIIVLNWNGKHDTLECLASLSALNASVLVVDNGSTDNSVAAIRERFPEISILETGKNLGYAGGNNAGISWALKKSFEWILIFNNDAAAAPDLIDRFLEAAEKEPSAKILGAKIYSTKDQRIEHLGGFWDSASGEFFFPAVGEFDNGCHEKMEKVDMVCGCAFFMHRSVPETIGLFEEQFFLLWEESDFCARAKRAGFSIWTAPKAKVFHKGSASFTGGKPHLQYFWWRNRLLWIQRNCSKKEKRQLYFRLLMPEMFRCGKLALLKTLQLLFTSDRSRKQKARRYRAGCRGIFHYFLGRFGDCPAVYKRAK